MRTSLVLVALALAINVTFGLSLFKRGGPPKNGDHFGSGEFCKPPKFVKHCRRVFKNAGVSDPCAVSLTIAGATHDVAADVADFLQGAAATTSYSDPFWQNAADEQTALFEYAQTLFPEEPTSAEMKEAKWDSLTTDQQDLITGVCAWHGCFARTLKQEMKNNEEAAPPAVCDSLPMPSSAEFSAEVELEFVPSAEMEAGLYCFALFHAAVCADKGPGGPNGVAARSFHAKTQSFKRMLRDLDEEKPRPKNKRELDMDCELTEEQEAELKAHLESMTDAEWAQIEAMSTEDFDDMELPCPPKEKKGKPSQKRRNAKEELKAALKRLLA